MNFPHVGALLKGRLSHMKLDNVRVRVRVRFRVRGSGSG